MELTIPLQTFETQKVRVGSPNRGAKLLAPFAYSDGDLQFHQISLLLPILPVKSYDADTGKLAISFQGVSGGLGTKLQALQNMIITAIYHQQQNWFPGERHREIEELRYRFQPMFEHGVLHVYCPCSSPQGSDIPLDIQVYENSQWTQGAFSPTLLQAGVHVRLLLKIQGISFHKHVVSGSWTGRFRIQHRVSAMFVPPSATLTPCPASEEP